MDINLIDLPTEIIEEIFSKLPKIDLMELTLVCKKFDDIISSNSRLMQQFRVMWNCYEENDAKTLVESCRNYSNLEIFAMEVFEINIFKFIKNHQSTLAQLKIQDSNLTLDEFGVMLHHLQDSLKEIEVCSVEFTNPTNHLAVPINLPRLKYFAFKGLKGVWSSALISFKNSFNVKVFEIGSDPSSYDDEIKYVLIKKKNIQESNEVLCSFKGLEKLTISHSQLSKFFRDDSLAKNATFQLKHLKIAYSNYEVFLDSGEEDEQANFEEKEKSFSIKERKSNFLKFLACQGNWLETVCFTEISITRNIIFKLLEMETLKEMHFKKCTFNINRYGVPIHRNYSITHVTLGDNVHFFDFFSRTLVLMIILYNCPNIQILNLENYFLVVPLSKEIIGSLRYLKEISFRFCAVQPIQFPTVTKMSIMFPKYCEHTVGNVCSFELIKLNRQLKYLMTDRKIQANEKFLDAVSGLQLEELNKL